MRKIVYILLLLALLVSLGACSKKTAVDLDAGPTPEPNPEEEAAIAEALADEDTTAVNWSLDPLSRVPAYTGSGDVVEWAANDEQAVVSLRDVTRGEVEAYAEQLEAAEFVGELTVVGGVDRFTGTYTGAGQRALVNLLFTAQTNEIEYSTFVITVVPN